MTIKNSEITKTMPRLMDDVVLQILAHPSTLRYEKLVYWDFLRGGIERTPDDNYEHRATWRQLYEKKLC